MYCFYGCKFENTNLVSQRAIRVDFQTEECADVFPMRVLCVQKAVTCLAFFRYKICISTSWKCLLGFYLGSNMSDIYKHLHTTNFENQYAAVTLAALRH